MPGQYFFSPKMTCLPMPVSTSYDSTTVLVQLYEALPDGGYSGIWDFTPRGTAVRRCCALQGRSPRPRASDTSPPPRPALPSESYRVAHPQQLRTAAAAVVG
eukprot:COSAG01_NODE_164_length_23340_cov_76.030033_18_plen_102_part_00